VSRAEFVAEFKNGTHLLAHARQDFNAVRTNRDDDETSGTVERFGPVIRPVGETMDSRSNSAGSSRGFASSPTATVTVSPQ
jgi:hypothetical protein